MLVRGAGPVALIIWSGLCLYLAVTPLDAAEADGDRGATIAQVFWVGQIAMLWLILSTALLFVLARSRRSN